MSRNRKLLAAKRVGGPLQNNLNHALTEAFPKFRIKTGFLESEDIDRVLLQGVHLKKRIARELKDSRAKGSATEQSADNSVDEDSADEDSADDSADEDGARKGGAHKDGAGEDGTDEEPADEDYTSKEDASDSSLQYSSLEDSLRVEPVLKESSPDTMQEEVKPASSNKSIQGTGTSAMEVGVATVAKESSQSSSSSDRKQSRRARATKKPGPTPVTNKDSQAGSSRDSKPWTEHDNQPAGSAENKTDGTAARRKRVSTRSPVPKLEHRPKKGVQSEKPEDGDIKEPDEVDPKAVYQDALKEVEGLESIINKLNSGKIYIGRSHEIEVRKLCLALHEFCSRKARNPDVRKRMLDAVRHELSISCPLFVWEEVEFSAPVEQPLQDTSKKTPKKQSEKKKKTKQGTSARKSSAYAKLKKLWSEINKSSESDKNRMRKLLEDTYEDRRAVPPSTLPEFFLDEYILSMEAEIRFGSDISALEEKLRKMAVVLSTALNRDFTIRAVCEYLDEGTSPSLITEGLVPVDYRDNSPRIYTMNGRLWIYTGSPGKTVEITSGRMERALVLCLVLYYIKYIDYPEAFWRVMYVLQFVLIPSDPPPPVPTRKNVPVCQVTYKMRGLLDLLTSNVDQRGPDAK
ncbi:uncharacterized protein LOC119174475 isoform X2 [Rhipicephalus microplus]|uniref:uncharacterized protein LOC119174475 isoform X2 n=1 Tax=Rhipicephalus microplus TaxID=6941 RepID=UPI003F6D9F0E